jgi:putative MATE family efflux protein
VSSPVSSHSHEPVIRLDLVRLWWPILIESLTGGLVTFVDTLFISQISDKAAASIGMLSSLLWLGYFILPQFTAAGTSVASQYLGAKRTAYVVPTYVGNLILSTGIGLILCVAMFAVSPFVGLWYGMTAEQSGYAQQYLSVIVFNFILVGARGAYASILSSRTLTKWNMITGVLINVLNIGLAAMLSKGAGFVPAMGIQGVALATTLSYAVGFAVLFVIVHARLKISFFIKDLGKLLKTVVRAILKVGIPSALEPLSYTMQSAVVSVLIIGLGYVAMGANTFVWQLLFFDLAVSSSLTSAGQIVMSHHLGARELDKVDRTYFKVLIAGALGAFGVVGLITVFHQPVLSLFTHNPAMIETAFWLLLLCLAVEPIRVANILSAVALKSVGDGKFSLTVGLIFMWAIVPLMFVAIWLGTGIVGLWVCLLLDEAIRAVINVIRWKGGKWRTKSVIG